MELNLNTQVYPQEAILNTCYAFLDKAYFFLDAGKNGSQTIKVSIKGKKKLSKNQLESLKVDFLNELLHCALRFAVSKNNKKIREYIIGRALYSSLPISDSDTKSKNQDYEKDPLGIGVPWEEKFGKKKRINVNAQV